MHPDLEFFLEEVFDDIEPVIPGVGRVIVEPDYDAEPAAADKPKLAEELIEFVKDHPDPGETDVPEGLKVLAKYIRRVTLRSDTLEGPWVEVAPPGYWI
ncbi:MAG: hypothetical protein JWP08_2562 [Bryobacterales bacterium]|jgi:hypothetical protein|nr:hypothetical protein [Bryobacterales bacterium]